MCEPVQCTLTAGAASINFWDFTGRRSASDLSAELAHLLPFVRRIPADHLRAVSGAHVYIINDFPGQRPYGGGGFYPQNGLANWQGRERVTGVADGYVKPQTHPYGLLAVLGSKIAEGITSYRYTVLHELAHMIDEELGFSAGLTVEQLRGMRYGRVTPTGVWRERATPEEYFAEAYSRWIINSSQMCREARDVEARVAGQTVTVAVPSAIPPGERQATCSTRVRLVLERVFGTTVER